MAVTNGANSRIDEEAAEAVQRAEQHEEVGGLEPWGAVAERDRGDDQREPAELEREQELGDELTAVGVRRPQGGHDRLPREDHHVAHFLQQALGRQECAIGDASDQRAPLLLLAVPAWRLCHAVGLHQTGTSSATRW
jgi:hypothetical protein